MSSNSDNEENVKVQLSAEAEKEQHKIVTSLLRPKIENEAKAGPTLDFEEFVDEKK